MDNDFLEKLSNNILILDTELVELKTMISDVAKCESEISKKYLIAAIKKQYTNIQSTNFFTQSE